MLLIDIIKGFVAVSLPVWLDLGYTHNKLVNFQIALGVAALLGHIFPVFASFRGGKGIATLLGAMLAVHPAATGLSAAVFLLVFVVSKYVSLGSMAAAVSFPVIIMLVYKSSIPSLTIFSLVIAVVVLFTHQKNIERLLRKEESKARIKLRSSTARGDDEDNDE